MRHLQETTGIITKAQQAKTETEESKEDELRRLTALEASTNLENYPYTDKNEDIATIPAGFQVSETLGMNTIQEGLVIQDEEGNKFLSEIGYTIDNTSKTRALFEINKGVGGDVEVNVNSKMTNEQRRVDFRNMIYIADGPSDVPAFSVVKGKGGATFAIYPQGNKDAFKQVERLREDGRIDMFAEADYSDGKTASMWICNKIQEFAERIKKEEQAKRGNLDNVPHHLV